MLMRLTFTVVLLTIAAVVNGQSTSPSGSSECQTHRDRELRANSNTNMIPECDEQGNYKPLQCHPPSTNGQRFCQCWDKEGNIRTSPSRKTKACECHLARYDATNSRLVGNYRPQCAQDGTFARTQCHGGTGHCWCVDPTSGAQQGEKVRGTVDCQ